MIYLITVPTLLMLQIFLAVIFYRILLRPLPRMVNEFLLERNCTDRLMEVSDETACIIREEIAKLERERMAALSTYCKMKGKRNLTQTEKNMRSAHRNSARQLDRQIKNLYEEVYIIHTPSIIKILEKFERGRLLRVLNTILDKKLGKLERGQ